MSAGSSSREGRLDELVPIENAAMEERTVIEWDKDDIDALGILKVDMLALGMLTCIRKAFDLLERHRGHTHDHRQRAAGGPGDLRYACTRRCGGRVSGGKPRADEFPAAHAPATFYDLVIEVAIVRPGPIQGGMVQPYISRRQGLERPVTVPATRWKR